MMMSLRFKIHDPIVLFLAVIFVFYIIPALIILTTDYTPVNVLLDKRSFDIATKSYVISLSLYLVVFSSTYILFNLKRNKIQTNKNVQREISLSLIYILAIASILLVFLYAFNGGFDKLFVLGDEEIGEAEFRFMNFNEVPRYYTAGLQVARRLIIPLCIVYMYAGYRLKLLNNGRFIFCCLVLLQLFASSLTMARAPFLMLLVGISFVHFITTESLAKKLILLVFYYLILVIMAGVITNLQYNITDFEYIDIFSMGLDFTSNRMLMVPTVVPINIVFSEFNFYSDPLLLKYSRIGGLLGLSVVGTLESDSIYVAPVGMIGDIYRNFNVIGVFLWGVFTGFLLNFIRDKWLKMSDIFKIIYSFAFIALIFYWTMGVVFSQGALMMLMTIFIFPIFVLKKFKF